MSNVPQRLLKIPMLIHRTYPCYVLCWMYRLRLRGCSLWAVATLWQIGGADEGGESWVAERSWRHPLMSVTVTIT